jgi:LuxR family maltose regulon positive regulatory protein
MNISSVRLTIPKAATGELMRKRLVNAVLEDRRQVTYIHAGAGYGKTTLLSQIALHAQSSVWAILDGESEVFSFLDLLSMAIRQTFPNYAFNALEYLPFEKKGNFITILSNAFIGSIENYSKELIIFLDDLHTIEAPQVHALIACIVKYSPEHIRFCLSSREAPRQELAPFRVRGGILELTQRDLAFTRDEAANILGFNDEDIYRLTEGWPIAVGSFKVLLENGVAVDDVHARGSEALYSYLFYECLSRLSHETADFLKSSACFEELEPEMLNMLLGKKNTQLLLESLVMRNIFTTKTDGGHYRYHTLFRDYLLKNIDSARSDLLQKRAANYYFEKKQYSEAAKYAIRLKDSQRLRQIILICYRDYIKKGAFHELRVWFQVLGDKGVASNRELLVAKGAYLSSIGNFTEASACLDAAIPQLCKDDRELYIEAMTHKARVLRNFISFEASNKLLDELFTQLDDPASEGSYGVVIEKIFNLCWDSRISEAYALCRRMVETCAKAGNIKVKAWYERYLSVIHFVAGRMKDSVYYYEKSMEIPENERSYLDMHSVDICVAKAYQMLGQRDRAVAMATAELQKLKAAGRYEELWMGYLLAAEIHFQNTSINRLNRGSATFETTVRYFTLAYEYAPLYRKTQFQMDLAKLLYNIYGLLFAAGDKEKIIGEIYENIPKVGDYFKTIALGRLFHYFGIVSDFERAASCAKRSIEIGERADMMMIGTLAYGMLARIALARGEYEEVSRLTRRFLPLCHENGSYEFFRMRKAYDPVLEFALSNGIEPEITREMMAFAGFTIKKAYIATLGGFSVYPYQNRGNPLKTHSKKERELLAFLLDAGDRGATKEQIYEALWRDSDSDDVKKLIGVNLSYIKRDLSALDLHNPVVNNEKHYSIRRDEIAIDADLFEEAARDFEQNGNLKAAQTILSLYKGEYLSDFEAHWAVAKRLKYAEIYQRALSFISLLS